jgi:hypothetical protein
MIKCNAPLGCKKNFWRALLVNFFSATLICKNCNSTSLSGTAGVQWTSGAEFFEASSLVGPVLILIISLAAYFQFLRLFCTSGVPCCGSISSLLLLLVTNLLKIVALPQRSRKIWNQMPSASFGLSYMSEGLYGIHLLRHCPFTSLFILYLSVDFVLLFMANNLW